MVAPAKLVGAPHATREEQWVQLVSLAVTLIAAATVVIGYVWSFFEATVIGGAFIVLAISLLGLRISHLREQVCGTWLYELVMVLLTPPTEPTNYQKGQSEEDDPNRP